MENKTIESSVDHNSWSYKYLFGPVASRRLGRSLGIDLLPFKTCTLDCVYCECGKTTHKTMLQSEIVPTHEVIAEIDQFVKKDPDLDYITFSGSGEPTLHSGIGKIIDHIKTCYPDYKIAVLTNGTLLFDPLVRKRLLPGDLVVPSLDAVTDIVYRKVNRPLASMDLQQMIDGLVTFRNEYSGQLWLEVFIVPGINDTYEELTAFKEVIHKIRPDRVQLNSLDRPGTEHWVESADLAALEGIREFFAPMNVEIISRAKLKGTNNLQQTRNRRRQILALLSRRPCTLADLVEALEIPQSEATLVLQTLLAENKIFAQPMERGEFFLLTNHEKSNQ